jgi:hypothetical protein
MKALFLLLAGALLSWGQSISGRVRDASDAALPQTAVTILNTETGAVRKLMTDGDGRFSAPALGAGTYQVRAEKPGFTPQVRKGISLAVGESTSLELSLAVGTVRDVMTVEEAPSAVEFSTDQTSGLVSERQVKDLPLNGRSYDQLLTLNAGTVNYTNQRSGGVGTSNSSVGNMFAISGRRPQENLFLLNGIEFTGASVINNTPGGASGQLLGVEAVREFNVVSDTYGAEYGKRPGGQVSIVTAAGTNELHGSIYEFLRNSAMDARNFFDQGPIPQFQRNSFGAALGGPIRRDKLFLFGNYEGFRQRLGESAVTLVPDNAARSGILPTGNVGVAAAVQPLLALWPVANGPELGGGIAEAFSHPLQSIREDFATARMDYNLSSRDTLFGVFTVDDSQAQTPTANPLSSIFESLREQVASVQEQHVFSPSVLHTTRIGYSRGGYYFTGQTPVDLPGWVQGEPIGAVVIGGGTALNAASQITLAGTNAGSNLSAVRNLFTVDDRIAIFRGRHQVEAGVWLQRLQANDNLAQYQYGQASFSSLASFLQGTISTFSVTPSPTALGWRSLEGAGYVQDAIRLTERLQLRLGFRFESTNGWNEANGRAANYVFDANGVIETNPRVGSSVFTVNRAKFLPEPRAALAWDPFGKGRTVIRAGFGIYRALLDNLDYRLDQTAPYNSTAVLKNVPVEGLQIVPGPSLPSGSKVSPSGVQSDAFTPTVLTWTFRLEQQVASRTAVGAEYVGSHGYHEMLSADVNEPLPTVCPAASCPSGLAAGTIYYPSGAALANPNLANTTTWLSEGLSSYQAVRLDVRRSLSRGFEVRAVYSFAKSLDDGTALNSSVGANAPGFVMFPLNPKWDWSLSNSDVRHAASINGIYQLPFRRNRLVSGWSMSWVATMQSGFPFTPQLGFNPTNNGDSRNPIRPSWNPSFSGPVVSGNPNQYFNPNAFSVPYAGTYGNVGRNVLIGPGLATLDASVAKITRINDRWKLQFRADGFNLFNRTNFNTPNAVVYTAASGPPASTAGVITATSTNSRQIQLSLKLLW